eukprot:CAMPEP_0119550188 /NCGR_PEP_ID=MMETSP1352-20130426/3741_1 /TAXON_ID=265584 /ORGANISM="Stauroneis constricta, Strain CCMP1120" /LENGTH=200 /DNA_ID=CAMNT_0007595947 /DNA_START=427 /DNA_END=1030 /DNA_ORIENTATION=+
MHTSKHIDGNQHKSQQHQHSTDTNDQYGDYEQHDDNEVEEDPLLLAFMILVIVACHHAAAAASLPQSHARIAGWSLSQRGGAQLVSEPTSSLPSDGKSVRASDQPWSKGNQNGVNKEEVDIFPVPTPEPEERTISQEPTRLQASIARTKAKATSMMAIMETLLDDLIRNLVVTFQIIGIVIFGYSLMAMLMLSIYLLTIL